MEGRISLFECQDKSGKRPHYKGYISINGEDHEFAVWPAKNGGKGFSGGYKPKQQRQEQAQQPAPEPQELGDEIPFAWLIGFGLSTMMLIGAGIA